MNSRVCRSFLAGLAVTGALSLNLGMRFAGNPGDCVVPNDSSFASLDGGCKDLATGRVWSYQPTTNWEIAGAKNYCTNLVEGGQSDWRMATIAELQAVVADGGYAHLALTSSANGWPGYNWSSTTAKGNTDYYAIRFSDGDVAIRGTKPGSKNGYWALPTICVR